MERSSWLQKNLHLILVLIFFLPQTVLMEFFQHYQPMNELRIKMAMKWKKNLEETLLWGDWKRLQTQQTGWVTDISLTLVTEKAHAPSWLNWKFGNAISRSSTKYYTILLVHKQREGKREWEREREIER